MDNKQKALIGAVVFGGAIAGLVLASKSTYVSPSPTPTSISPPSYTTIPITTQFPISPVTGTPTSSPISTTPVSTSSPPSNGVTLVNQCGNQVLLKVTNANGVQLAYTGFNPGSQTLQLTPDQFPLTVCFNNEAGGGWQCQKVTNPGTVSVPSNMCIVFNYVIRNPCSIPIQYVTPQEGTNVINPGQSITLQLYPGDQNKVFFTVYYSQSSPRVNPTISGNIISPSTCSPLTSYYDKFTTTSPTVTYTVTNNCSQNLFLIAENVSQLNQKVIPAKSTIKVTLPSSAFGNYKIYFQDGNGNKYNAQISGSTITTTQCPSPLPTSVITYPTASVSLNPNAPAYKVIGTTSSKVATVEFEAYCIAGGKKIPAPTSTSIQIYKYAQVFGALSLGGEVANVHPFTKTSIPIGGPYIAGSVGGALWPGTVNGSQTFMVTGNGTIEIDYQAQPIYHYTYQNVQKILPNGQIEGYRVPVGKTLIGYQCPWGNYNTSQI